MDSRMIGIVGGVLLVIGVFCPLVGVDLGAIMGQPGQSMNVSFFSPQVSWEGIVLILLGIAGIALAVLRKTKLLLVPGILALAIVAYDYFSFKSKFSSELSGVGEARRAEIESAVSMKWGWVVLILGALALIAAGALGRNLPAPGAGYGAPPPPPPYTPGR